MQTVDFFTPIVDDPYDFGQIAAANALSDVYAMGGLPRTALAITALPKNGPPAEVIREVFRGGGDVLRKAGVALLGGHTVTDPEIKFGYSVTGEVDPDRILTNASARVGDTLVLTKPLGTGIVVRARKYGQGTDDQLAAAVASMKRLNDEAAIALRALPKGSVSACTDVTGFGLAGHAIGDGQRQRRDAGDTGRCAAGASGRPGSGARVPAVRRTVQPQVLYRFPGGIIRAARAPARLPRSADIRRAAGGDGA